MELDNLEVNKNDLPVDSNVEKGKCESKTSPATLNCIHCKTSLISTDSATYIADHQFQLPASIKKTETSTFDLENCIGFWLVNDIFTFDNIGVSRKVESTTYLCCPECEIGPVGYFLNDNMKEIYVSEQRVAE